MDEQVVKTAGESLSKASDFFSSQKTEHLLNMAAGQKVEEAIKGFDKLKVFSAAAKYTGLAAIGIDVFSSLAGIKSTEEKMMNMITALSEQISSLHKETQAMIQKHDERSALGQSLGRLAEPIAYIQSFQKEVDGYWSTKSEFKEVGFDGMGDPGVIIGRQMSDLHLRVQQIANEFSGELPDSNVLAAVYDWSNGDFSEVNQFGRLLFDLVAAAPILEGTYWRIHCQNMAQTMSPDDIELMMDSRKEEILLNRIYSDHPEDNVKSAATIVAESLQSWGTKCLSWENLLAHHQSKAQTIIKDLSFDNTLSWPQTGRSVEIHALHEQIAQRLIDELSAAYLFDWAVMVQGYGGEWHGQTFEYDCSLTHHVATPLYANDLKTPTNNSQRVDIMVCAIDTRMHGEHGEADIQSVHRPGTRTSKNERILDAVAKVLTDVGYFFGIATEERNPEFLATFPYTHPAISPFTGILNQTISTPDGWQWNEPE